LGNEVIFALPPDQYAYGHRDRATTTDEAQHNVQRRVASLRTPVVEAEVAVPSHDWRVLYFNIFIWVLQELVRGHRAHGLKTHEFFLAVFLHLFPLEALRWSLGLFGLVNFSIHRAAFFLARMRAITLDRLTAAICRII
jgi:hypothetical protein